MTERLRKWWTHRPRLHRGHRIALNLTLCVLGLTWIWGMLGYPLPTAKMEYRRLERVNLLRPAHTVCVLPEEGHVGEHGSYELTQPWVVGLGEEQVSASYVMRTWKQIETFPLEDGPTPVPMNGGNMFWWSRSGYVWGFRCPLLFVQIPEEAVSARLELDVTYQERDYHREGEGFRLENGMWLFAIDSPDTSYTHDWYQGGAYTLRLYDGDGALIMEENGIIPEPIR